MKNWHCVDCGWFDPEKDGSFFCDSCNRTVFGGSKPCKYLELQGGIYQEPIEVEEVE